MIMLKTNRVTVLITSAGGEAALNCLHALRKQKKFEIKIVCVDKSPLSAGLYLADKYYIVPDINQREYLDKVLDICLAEKVNVILPIYSKEIPLYAKNLNTFQEINVEILISSYASVSTFINKWMAYLFFLENNIVTPTTWLLSDFKPLDNNLYPLYIKPCVGSGSKDNYFLADYNDFAYYQNKTIGEYIIQKYIDAPEYTIDIVADRYSKIVTAIPRERLKTKSGMAVTSRTVKDDSAIQTAESIISNGGLVGPVNIQYFRLGNDRYFFDVNTRFSAGGLPLAVAAGTNIPLVVVQLALGLPVKCTRKYKSLTMIRYYTELFIQHQNL